MSTNNQANHHQVIHNQECSNLWWASQPIHNQERVIHNQECSQAILNRCSKQQLQLSNMPSRYHLKLKHLQEEKFRVKITIDWEHLILSPLSIVVLAKENIPLKYQLIVQRSNGLFALSFAAYSLHTVSLHSSLDTTTTINALIARVIFTPTKHLVEPSLKSTSLNSKYGIIL